MYRILGFIIGFIPFAGLIIAAKIDIEDGNYPIEEKGKYFPYALLGGIVLSVSAYFFLC